MSGNRSINRDDQPQQSRRRRPGCLGVLGIILLTFIVTVAGTIWVVNSRLFAAEFEPVELNNREQSLLDQKLEAIGIDSDATRADSPTAASTEDDMQPERYREDDSKRRISLTERELNALLAKNTDLAEQLVIDLADDVASVKILINLDPDFPFFGGKTLKVSSGANLSYGNGRPAVVLQGVSVWGVPIPNAWLGGLKHIDLVREFGGAEGFWKAFADGIEDIQVNDGKLLIQLAE